MKEKQDSNVPGSRPADSTPSFSVFSKITGELHRAYQDLREKYEHLNLRLEEANVELKHSLGEKERLYCYLSSILESLSSGVLAADLSGKVILFNRAAETILHYPAGEAIGKHYAEVMGGETKEKLALPFVLQSGESRLNEEKEIRAKNGEKIPVSCSSSLLKDPQGEVLGAVEVFSDQTELKRMEGEVTQVRTLAAIGEIAAVVVHEVKNPLGGIRGFAELLQRDLEEGDPRRRCVDKIVEGVDALDRIVKSLLDYTKPVKLNLHNIEMTEFVDEVISFFRMDISQKGAQIRIVKRYPEGELFCQLDDEQFRQILLNLLHNAVEAMPHGGELTVDLNQETRESVADQKPTGSGIMLRLSDTGIGMNRETLDKLFTPFFTTKPGGTGLGLSTVKKIVEAHRGWINVDSEPGKGTTVLVRLPQV
jgi:PAS domain S-box-containing protein